MKTNKINAAGETAHEAEKLLGVSYVVVHSCPADILEREPALFAPIVLTHEIQYMADGRETFGRHDGCTLFRIGIMQRDSEVTIRLFQKALQRILLFSLPFR